MGGTFDPIHHGHLVCAEEARHRFELEEVIFIPAGQPWQKEGMSSVEDRYLMTMFATSTNESFSVSRVEIDRPGPTYTLDTLRTMRGFYGEDADLYFITGADAVLDILSWKEPDEVLALARFVAATRPGFELSRLTDAGLAKRVVEMQVPSLAISSTEIRQRVRDGLPIRYLTAHEVVSFIYERGLYREATDATPNS